MRRKIGYDARMIEHSGIGVRIQHILKYWPLEKEEAELFVFGDEMLLKKHSLPSHAKIIPYTAGIYSIREWFGHSQMRKMDFLDIPHFNVPFLFIKKCIVTIHDLIPYHFKSAHSSFLKRIYLQLTLRIISLFAHRIIAVSNYTRDDFLNHFHSDAESITVIYNGIDPEVFSSDVLKNMRSFRHAQNLPQNFLLTIGIGKKHKNFDFLFENLTELWRSGKLKIPLVIGGLGNEIPKELTDFKIHFPNQIYFLNHLPYHDLPKIYKMAKVFLFPSLFEGFGFPVLEAQAMGTPVISSDATVLPEILRDSAILFDGRNSADFQKKLLATLSDPSLLLRLAAVGQKNSKRFHWREQIRRLKVFYQSILA